MVIFLFVNNLMIILLLMIMGFCFIRFVVLSWLMVFLEIEIIRRGWRKMGFNRMCWWMNRRVFVMNSYFNVIYLSDDGRLVLDIE